VREKQVLHDACVWETELEGVKTEFVGKLKELTLKFTLPLSFTGEPSKSW